MGGLAWRSGIVWPWPRYGPMEYRDSYGYIAYKLLGGIDISTFLLPTIITRLLVSGSGDRSSGSPPLNTLLLPVCIQDPSTPIWRRMAPMPIV